MQKNHTMLIELKLKNELTIEINDQNQHLQRGFRRLGEVLEVTSETPFHTLVLNFYKKYKRNLNRVLDSVEMRMLRIIRKYAKELPEDVLSARNQERGAEFFVTQFHCSQALENEFIDFIIRLDEVCELIETARLSRGVEAGPVDRHEDRLRREIRGTASRIASECSRGKIEHADHLAKVFHKIKNGVTACARQGLPPPEKFLTEHFLGVFSMVLENYQDEFESLDVEAFLMLHDTYHAEYRGII